VGVKKERAARLLGRAVFYGSLLLVALAAVPYGSVEFWWTALFDACVFALGMLWALESLLGGGLRLSRESFMLLLPPLALVLFSLFQTVPLWRAATAVADAPPRQAISADPFETYTFALRLLALVLLGAIWLRFTTSRRRLTALVLTVVCVGAASALFGILRQGAQASDVGFVLPALRRGVGYGQIISRNQFAFMMEMALGLSLGLAAARAGGFTFSLFQLSLALPVGLALILANSRGGILTMLCQLLFLSLLAAPAWSRRRDENRAGFRGEDETRREAGSRSKRQSGGWRDERRAGSNGWRRRAVSLAARLILAVALLSLVSVAVVWVGGERVVENMSTVGEELGAGEAREAATRWNTRRVDIWRATWEMFKENPAAGVGLGGYWAAIPRYHDASGEYTPQQAHNDYLELLASGGLVGTALFAWLVYALLRRAREVLRGADRFRRAAAIGALAGLFGVAVHSLFDFGLHLTINAALFVALVVLATADVKAEDGKRAVAGSLS
jgi:O-antigen ligase